MSKIYLLVMPGGERLVTAIFDLDNMPAGVVNTEVAPGWKQGDEVVSWLCEDEERAERIVSKIANRNIDDESRQFLSRLASLWENVFPANEAKDAFIGVTLGKGQFVRTSPEIAKDVFEKMRTAANRSQLS